LLVYDVSRRDSFEHVKAWYDRAKQLGGEDLICVLVGNKNDLDNGSADLLDTFSGG
jgi:GTPase SAR1 family protein